MYIVGSGVSYSPRRYTPITDLIDNTISMFENRTGRAANRIEIDSVTYKDLLGELNNAMYTQYTPQELYTNGITYKGVHVHIVYVDYVHILVSGSSEGIKTTKLESTW
jgi:hypothetical protein